MTDEQRELLESLFERAVAIDPAERHSFLMGACGDATVVREVESLLQFARTGSASLASPVQEAASRLSKDWVHEGRRIGPYRIEREIGVGGMGAVYLASRDEEFRKTVALKLLGVGMQSEAAVRRFRKERQILAGLEHSNIARLLDGGTTDEGWPYIAMEYIAGIPITQYAVERRLSINAKLQLFRQLCDGVQWAHQKLVIHRDIKPGNILVTEEGIPKLLDFGIAKLTAPDTMSDGLPETATIVAMTPDYASPEQVRGDAVTLTTDVYALGAVLFELLTGQRAHRLRSYDPLELVREICQTEIRAPSTTGVPGLRGDLDNIVMKAMRKDPARRYNSAEQFSEDIRRYLEGEPVLARAATLTYRAGKFVRRHAFALAALTAVILAMGLGMLAALHEARLAESRFAEGRKLASRLFEIHDELKKMPGTTAPRQLVVTSALEYLDRLAPTAGDDPGFEWELARAYERTGDAQGSPSAPSLGRTKDAVVSYQKAIRIEEDLLNRNLLDEMQRESLARCYQTLSALQGQLHEGDRAVAAAARAVTLSAGLSPRNTADSYTLLAAAQQSASDSLGALEAIKMALTYDRKLTGADALSPEKLAAQYLVAARVAQGAVRFDDALRFAESGIDLFEKHMQSHTNDAVGTRGLLLTYLTAADCLGANNRPSLGNSKRAMPYYQKALKLAERMAAADASNATARFDLAIAAGKTASLLDASDPREAIRLYRQALDATERLFHEGIERSSILAAYYASVAIPRANLGLVTQAREDFREAVRLMDVQSAKAPNDAQTLSDTADTWRTWGDMEFTHGNPDAALDHTREAVRRAEKAVQLAPRGVRAAWHLSAALESLSREEDVRGRQSGDARLLDGARQARERVAEIWRDWDRRLPGTPYLQARRREAEESLKGP